MRLDLFSQGDNVLLLGEGNFSFTKSLFTHNLPIKITATCFDNGVKYKSQPENIEFLIKNGIRVFIDVDATKLHEHPILRNQEFSKIIFNFPHVGGKMKIQLNRQLIRKICESSSHLLPNNGLLVFSLCNGQGGTPADNPQRKWDDSWQVTEMAAYGSFALISVEPFDFNNYPSYKCTGYRSQDSHFNLNGALVHVFKKKVTPPRLIHEELINKRLTLVPLNGLHEILVPSYYSDLYSKNALNNSESSVCFFKNLLLKHLKNRKNLKILEDKNVLVVVEGQNGVVCKFSEKYQRLRSSTMQIINNIIEEFNNWHDEDKVIFFPGMFFNSSISQDFDRYPPVLFQFVLLGKSVSVCFKDFFIDLITLFKKDEVELHCRRIFSKSNCGEVFKTLDCEDAFKNMNKKTVPDHVNEWHCTDHRGIENIVAHELHLRDEKNIELEAVTIYVEKLTEIFFCTRSWKEYWSADSFVSLDPKETPILKQGLLHPLCYKFDITLKYETEKGLLEDDVYEVLRMSAIDLIKEVEMINEYNTKEWSSKCFRITYQSLNEPLNRSKALDIHTQLISKMLTRALPVTIK